MQTNLAEFIRNTSEGQEADGILRKCVHCGFCTATCPTYQLLGDELDGPRGRIYLMKQMLEGQEVKRPTQIHLDRCLTCRSCETTCPSGVRYGRLLDISREMVEGKVKRPIHERMLRWILRKILPYPNRFGPGIRMVQSVRPLLPPNLKRKIPAKATPSAWPSCPKKRQMLILEGCVQAVLAPNINASAARVLDRLGISLIRANGSGCCGAIDYHLGHQNAAKFLFRRNIDAWWPHIEQKAEAIVTTASGCGVMIKEYGEILKADPQYAVKALRLSELTKDISEILANENLQRVSIPHRKKVALHCPCTLQHGQKISGTVDQILNQAGFALTKVIDPHLCCGSAGTYSILQESISRQLLSKTLTNLQTEEPQLILTSNIGCLMHLRSGTQTPVRHWIEELDKD